MKPAVRFAIVVFALAVLCLPIAVNSYAQSNTALPQANTVSPPQAGAESPGTLSHVRIVRLSFTEGTVTMHRPDATEWGAAPTNTPIQEGFKLSTAENSFAEVEFENTSTARIGQLSLLDFDQLAANSEGAKLNRMTLEQGYGTFNVIPELTNSFEVKAQEVNVAYASAATTRFRIDIDGGAVRVEVFQGVASVTSPYGQQTLTPNMVAEIRPGADQPFKVSTGITKDAWDQWVDAREQELSVVRNSPSPKGVGGQYYGWNDLSAYGGWDYFSGYGWGWFPYSDFGWVPYSNGQWCWYPGFGYAWISFEPWGWLPYHFGGWQFYPGLGWVWFPGAFGAWSPANVAWWEGGGAVGWSPLPPKGGPGRANRPASNCPHGQVCGRVMVRPETVQQGKPVQAGLLANVVPTKIVPRIELPPEKGGLLPGKTFAEPASVVVRPGIVTATEAGNSKGSAATSGIVFNPRTGGYENNPKAPSAPNEPIVPAAQAAAKGAPAQAAAPTVRGVAAPTAKPAWGSAAAAPAPAPSHSAAPSYHPSTTQSGSSGGSHSGYSGSSSGGWGGHSGGGSSGGWESSGSSHSSGGSGGGASSGGGGGCGHGGGGGGGGSSSSTGGHH